MWGYRLCPGLCEEFYERLQIIEEVSEPMKYGFEVFE